jgi:hypothetical protein
MSGSQQHPSESSSLSRRAHAVNAISGFKDVGIGYFNLAQEPIFNENDKRLLAELYQQAGISVEPQTSTKSPATNQSQQEPLSSAPQSLPGLSSSNKENSIPGLHQEPLSQQTSQAPIAISKLPAPPPMTAASQVHGVHNNDEPQSQEAKRKLFLARLQAAKSKKSSIPSGSPASSQAPSSAVETTPTTMSIPAALHVSAVGRVAPAPADSTASAQAATSPSTSTAMPLSVPRRDPTNVVRLNNAELQRRMESMREQAALNAKSRPVLPSRSTSISSIDYSQGRDSDASDSSHSPGEPSHAIPRATPPTGNAATARPAGVSQTQSRQSIPGLFMAEPAADTQQSKQPVVSQPPTPPSFQSVSQSQRPVSQHAPIQYSPARNGPAYPTSSYQQQTNALKRPASATSGPVRFGAPKRQYGFRPYETYDEQVVIDISSDEDEEGSDVMDLDDEEAEPEFSRPPPSIRHPLPQRPPATASGIPSRPNFNGRPFQQNYSAPSSSFHTPPTTHTPNPTDIQRQHDAIEQERKKLQEQLNRKLQEKKMGKDGAIASPGQATPNLASSTLQPSLLAENPSSSGASRPTSSAGLVVKPIPKIISSSALRSPGPDAINTTRRQPNFPPTKTAIASRIEMLRKRQQELEEEARRRRQELEDEIALLGVDPDGMTQEEMQATVNELADEAIEQEDQQADIGPSPVLLLPVVEDAPNDTEHVDGDGEEGEILESMQPSVPAISSEFINSTELPEPDVGFVQESALVMSASPAILDDSMAEVGLDADSDLEQDELLDTDDDNVPDDDDVPDEIDQQLIMVSSSSSDSDSDDEGSDDDDSDSDDSDSEIPGLGQAYATHLRVSTEGSSSEASSDPDPQELLNSKPEHEADADVTDSDSAEDVGSSLDGSDMYEPQVVPLVQTGTEIALAPEMTTDDLDASDVYYSAPIESGTPIEEPQLEQLETGSDGRSVEHAEDQQDLIPSLLEEATSDAANLESAQATPAVEHVDEPMELEGEKSVHSEEPLAENEDVIQSDDNEDELLEHEETVQFDDNEDELYEPKQTISSHATAPSGLDPSIQPSDGVSLVQAGQSNV